MTRVVCISRAMAAGGEMIGRLAAEGLGFRYVDEQIITRAAREARVDPALVAKAEQRQRLLERLLDKLPTARDLASAANLAGVPVAFGSGQRGRAQPEEMRAFIRAAVYEVARQGDAVIVAHGASMALAGMGDVLRVLVTASRQTRATRLAESESLSPADAAAAVDDSDRERRDYFRRFYGVDEELPTHYDLTINTDVLGPSEAAAAVAATARAAG